MNNNELNVGEILLLKYIDGHELPKSVPNYFEHYGVDFKKSIKKMFDNSYLEYAPLEYALSKRSVAELKSVLECESLPTKGKKDILVSRILENISHDRFKGFDTAYCLTTDKGKQIISENDHVFFFHDIYNRIGINIYDADAYKMEHPTLSNVEIALNMLDDRKTKRAAEGKYSLVRNVYSEKAFVCYNNERPLEALKHYCVVCCFDRLFSESKAFCNMNDFSKKYINRDLNSAVLRMLDEQLNENELVEYEGVISPVKEIITAHNIPESTLKEYITEAISEIAKYCK